MVGLLVDSLPRGYGFRVKSKPKPEILIICIAHHLQVPLEVLKVWEGSIVETWRQPI